MGLLSYTGGDMKLSLLISSCLLFALPLAAQTATSHASSSQATATAHHPAAAVARCAHPAPAISPKIPALPASSGCVKILYTVTRIPTTRLDYASPLVTPEVRDELGSAPATFSLDYADITVGSGEPAKPHLYYTVKYTGWLDVPGSDKDGTKFDSSDDHPGKEPITFPYGAHRVIPGWDSGFEGMRVGGKRRLYIPYELAYGENGRGPIPPKAMLVFDMELVSQSDKAPEQAQRPMQPHPMPPAGATPPPSGSAAPATKPQ
jgi:peptidylprolyl isomerase